MMATLSSLRIFSRRARCPRMRFGWRSWQMKTKYRVERVCADHTTVASVAGCPSTGWFWMKFETDASFTRRSGRGCILGKSLRWRGPSISGEEVASARCESAIGGMLGPCLGDLGGAPWSVPDATLRQIAVAQIFIRMQYVICLAVVPEMNEVLRRC